MIVGVGICDPTTQLRSRAEPEDPVYSPYLPLLRLQSVSASLPDLSLPYCTSPYFTFFTSVHLLISHLSPVPPIFPSVCLCYPNFLRTLMFHPYLLCSTRVVFKISSCIPYPVTFGFLRNPDVAGNGRSEGRKRVRPIAIDYCTVAGTAGAGCKGDRRSKGPDSWSPFRTPMALWRHKGKET